MRIPRPHWRKMTWVLIAWVALITAWIAAGVNSAECENEQYTDACEAGTGIGVAIIVLLGFLGFFALALVWIMTRPRGRTCPTCGNRVRKGHTTCADCGHDFRQGGVAAIQ